MAGAGTSEGTNGVLERCAVSTGPDLEAFVYGPYALFALRP